MSGERDDDLQLTPLYDPYAWDKAAARKQPQERQQSRRPLFFSPKVRKENEETQTRADRLNNYIFEREELAGFENLAGEDEYVTLREFFQIAEEAAEQGNRAKLVALKRYGQSLLEKMYPAGNDRTKQAWEWDFEKSSGDRLKVRAAEMIILKAEMEYLKLRDRKGNLDSIPTSQKDALARQFRHYARNADLPADFQKELLAAHRMIKPVQVVQQAPRPVTFEEEALRTADVLAEEAKRSVAETVARQSAFEETVVERKQPDTTHRTTQASPEEQKDFSQRPPRGFIHKFRARFVKVWNDVQQHPWSSAGWALAGVSPFVFGFGLAGLLGAGLYGVFSYYLRKWENKQSQKK